MMFFLHARVTSVIFIAQKKKIFYFALPAAIASKKSPAYNPRHDAEEK